MNRCYTPQSGHMAYTLNVDSFTGETNEQRHVGFVLTSGLPAWRALKWEV